MTILLMTVSELTVNYWYLIPGIPISVWLFIKLLRKFNAGRVGWDMFVLKMPIFGQLIEKNILARTTRTLGTLVASRRADSRRAEHHPRNERQRRVREHVRQDLRIDSRGRIDRQADERILQDDVPPDGGVLLVLLLSAGRSDC